MNEMNYQELFNRIEEYLPKDWASVILFAGYTSGSYSIKFYVDCGDGKFIDCFTFCPKSQLIKTFMSLNKDISAFRAKLGEKDKWSVMTMKISSDGKMKTEYDYADLDENMVAYEKAWKEKYL